MSNSDVVDEFEICLICGEQQLTRSFAYHVSRQHKIKIESYVLRFKYADVRPTCACGCGNQTKWSSQKRDFYTHVAPHGLFGHAVSEETRRKIGKKNSENMKEYHRKHPEAAKSKMAMMRQFLTPEVEARRIETLRKSSKTPERKQAASKNALKLWSEDREKMREASRKGRQTLREKVARGEYSHEVRNRKISETITRRYLEGGFCWATGTYVSTKTGKSCGYRSSWELELMKQLDQSELVKTWNFEFDKIEYVLDGKVRYYIPDFLVETSDGRKFVIEVKPVELLNCAINLAKQQAAESWCKTRGYVLLNWSLGNSLETVLNENT